ncbi:hypothetical protein BT63DRAFT_29545 [Microthyrium microscopicum]|uniref:SPT2-domain-containing protein n=1 Tax=Microthyrium microscopicum TaxID=703497 RepID=A0A6A6US79_9PEZI|nr:hypothetical protein BT63DRAFT_29545 [Microthyrium microscopicum]
MVNRFEFFNSLLASAGGDVPPAPLPRLPRPTARETKRAVTHQPDNNIPAASTSAKRKAEDDLPDNANKSARTESMPASDQLKPPSRPVSAPLPASGPSKPPPKIDAPLKKALTHAATMKASASAKPTTSTTPSAPPAKGSFAEQMARAKALQNSKLGQGPKITNKSAPNKTKETIKELRRNKVLGRKGAAPPSKARIASRSGSEEVRTNKKGKVEEKPKRKPVEVAYKGTMKPSTHQSSYKGTANLKSAPARRPERLPSRYERYESEDEEDYESDGSSDMEAGAWDLEREEKEALRAARAEDAAALREEERLKREKLQRKQSFARR